MNAELLEFTRQALARNIARPEIAATLRRAGWSEEDIHTSLGSFAEIDFPLPVPRPKPYLSAREVFLYLVMFSALYDSSVYAASLIFDFINKSFPDPAMVSRYGWAGSFQDSVRMDIANLVVALPLFLVVFRSNARTIAADPARRASKPRKWLTYLTLFLATVTLTCDLGTIVYNLLGGELTTRFVLKALTVAIIAGGNFWYFLHDMRQEEQP